MNKPIKNLFIRFGEIPDDERSNAYRGDEILSRESGVSVWRAILSENNYYPVLPDNPNESTIADYFSFITKCDRNVYLVTGDECKNLGSDNEPLLRNVKIIKDITDSYVENPKSNTTTETIEDERLETIEKSLADKGISISFPRDITAVRNFYKTVKESTPNCAWTNEYPGYKEIVSDIDNGNLFVLERNGEIIGSITIIMYSDIWLAKFYRIAIHPSIQGQGLGRLIVQWAIEFTKEVMCVVSRIQLSVWEENVAAQKMYESIGFKNIGKKHELRGKMFDVYEKELK